MNDSSVYAAKRQIAQWVTTRFDPWHVNRAEQLIIPFGHTAVVIDVTQLPTGNHRIYINSPVVVGVPASDELAQFVGWRTGNFLFGSLGLRLEDESPHSLITVEFDYSMYFEAASMATLLEAVGLVARTSLELADDVRSRFGGEWPV